VRRSAPTLGTTSRLLALCLIAMVPLGASVSPALAEGPGSLDLAFGRAGRVVTGFGAGSGGRAMGTLSDGRIVVAGDQGSYIDLGGHLEDDNDFAVARYMSSGALDMSFGRDGQVTTDVGGKGDKVEVALTLPSGETLVAGYALTRYIRRCCNPDTDFAIVRYNSNGTLHHHFGDDGRVLTDFRNGDGVDALVVQADGMILAGGWSYTADGTNLAFALARYEDDGSLDQSFGEGGKVLTEIDQGSLRALSLQPDGKILAAGAGCCTDDGQDLLLLIRYNVDGSIDTSFGVNGIVTTPTGSFSFEGDTVFASDGSIFAAGFGYVDLPNENCSCPTFAVAHFNADGTWDRSFGGDGQVLAFARGSSYAYGMAVQADGKIVAAGVLYKTRGSFALARFDSDGSRDQTFGRHGKVITRFDHYRDVYARAVAIDSLGRIVTAGRVGNDNYAGRIGGFALARYLG
jgi:uncharacterized delta-60 repeat protein